MGDLARTTTRSTPSELSDGWDVCIVHDPQPAALASLVADKARNWVWRCHIDLSTPNPATLDRLLPLPRAVPGRGVPHAAVRAAGDGRPSAHIVPPAIDPLAPKNMAFSPEDAVYICDQFGIDVDRPLLCQVSRFDPWKDPLGVIDAYRIVKEQMPDVQLALVGSMATDDPEGWDYFNATVAHADGDPDIHILNNLNNVGAIEVNAFQSHSRRGDPEVDARGLRADRHRGDLEGATVHRRRRRRDPAADRRRRVGLSRLAVSRSARSGRSRSCATPALGKRLGRAGKEHVTPALPDARGCCATGCELFEAAEGVRSSGRCRPPLVLVSNRGPVTFEPGGGGPARAPAGW